MRILTATAVLIVLLSLNAFGAAATSPQDLFENYMSALKDGRFADAENCWDASTVEASKRLGITYDDIPAKYDCASPLVTLLPNVRAGLITVSVDTVVDKANYSEISATLSTQSDTSLCRYIAIKSADGWKLISPLQALTSNWKVRKTKYVRLFYSDSTLINDYACAELDRFIEITGKRLGLTGDDFDLLEKEKILYYLCDETQIKDIAGYNTQGMADLPLDAVVSRPLPHRHEVTHLLVNFAEKHIPLYTMPFLQEGTASFFGGRWGRSPRTIMYTGAAIIRNNITDPADVLTYDDFHGVVGTPDISYPISAILVDCLLARMNPRQFLDLYRALSGPLTYVRSFTKEDIMAMLGKFTGASWNVLDDDIRHFADSMKTCGIDPVTALPSEAPLLAIGENGVLTIVRIWSTDDSFQFEIVPRLTGESGILLISTDGDAPTGFQSRLFAQHAPGESYHGEPFGIKFTEAEVSCYDYHCDELTGIYVPGFAGTMDAPAPDLWDASARTYRFAVDKSLFPSSDPSTWHVRIVSF